MFRLPKLSSPEAFGRYFNLTVRQCKDIIEDAFRPSYYRLNPVSALHAVDKCAQMMCSVSDPARFISLSNPDEKWRRTANSIFLEMSSFMREVNGSEQNIEFLRSFLSIRNQSKHLFSPSELLFIDSLETEMVKGVVNLSTTDRVRLMECESFIENAEHLIYSSAEHERYPIVEQLLKNRLKLANLLGFKSFFDYSTASAVAKTSAVVLEYLEEASKSKAGLIGLGERRNPAPGSSQMSISDFFKYVEALFELRFQERKPDPVEVWNDCVSVFEIQSTGTSVHVGTVYLDESENLAGLNASFSISVGVKTDAPPIYVITCAKDTPRHTLFHEFGHVIQGILSVGEFYSNSGNRESPDYLEIHSTFLELLPAVVSGDLSPWKPFDILYQTFLADVDARFHSLQSDQQITDASLKSIVTKSRERYGISNSSHFHGYLTHLGGYGGVYFSYPFATCFATELWLRLIRKEIPLSSVRSILFSSCGRMSSQDALHAVFGHKTPVFANMAQIANEIPHSVLSVRNGIS
ncbi:mitochondrial probable mitochondrial intermediate peptidase [Andalucia godoyi]|uniref:Mitochondrial probable mitochondrial intermediate peptidase n=1 Tax=Andalucia godoyi TaxID=505711 RepID=A0A8K0F4D2_ANDGO|nr:mitochondrial probable mitochondrial intermediate peptidase [Andalucia godoyi]|eukprot:ANDGO_07597.mRNA.1 mitochondrial probable mitochondrial intermediate peptidase